MTVTQTSKPPIVGGGPFSGQTEMPDGQRQIPKSSNNDSKSANAAPEYDAHPGTVLKLPYGFGPVPADNDRVFFFDIDNCLYHASYQIHHMMQQLCRRYMMRKLNISYEQATELNIRYYKEFGLSIQGLVRSHQIDALEFNREVDDSLPLHEILKPDHPLREMIIRLRLAGKVQRLWLFTNAYKTHAIRVLRLLHIADLFDGMTFCDYENQTEFICKPDPRAFHRAMRDAGVADPKNAYFVDDSSKNCQTAVKLGFSRVVNVIDKEDVVLSKDCLHVRTVHGLPEVLPELFVKG